MMSCTRKFDLAYAAPASALHVDRNSRVDVLGEHRASIAILGQCVPLVLEQHCVKKKKETTVNTRMSENRMRWWLSDAAQWANEGPQYQ
jgi:hypothetical protein